MFKTDCSCLLNDDDSTQCTCGWGAQYRLLERLWQTTSRAECREILGQLELATTRRLPFPPDINEVNGNNTHLRGGDRHPRWPAFTWYFGMADGDQTNAWRWRYSLEKGN